MKVSVLIGILVLAGSAFAQDDDATECQRRILNAFNRVKARQFELAYQEADAAVDAQRGEASLTMRAMCAVLIGLTGSARIDARAALQINPGNDTAYASLLAAAAVDGDMRAISDIRAWRPATATTMKLAGDLASIAVSQQP